jgi:hypothetical protein
MILKSSKIIINEFQIIKSFFIYIFNVVKDRIKLKNIKLSYLLIHDVSG